MTKRAAKKNPEIRVSQFSVVAPTEESPAPLLRVLIRMKGGSEYWYELGSEGPHAHYCEQKSRKDVPSSLAWHLYMHDACVVDHKGNDPKAVSLLKLEYEKLLKGD